MDLSSQCGCDGCGIGRRTTRSLVSRPTSQRGRKCAGRGSFELLHPVDQAIGIVGRSWFDPLFPLWPLERHDYVVGLFLLGLDESDCRMAFRLARTTFGTVPRSTRNAFPLLRELFQQPLGRLFLPCPAHVRDERDHVAARVRRAREACEAVRVLPMRTYT